MVSSFLKDRTFKVEVDGSSSELQQIPFGVPQGAVCSPVLYNLYISDAPDPFPCLRALYADDTSFMFSAREKGRITSALRQTMLSNMNFYRQWKINLNLNKSMAKFFTRRRTKEIPLRPLRIGPTNTLWSNEPIKYLGVWLDKTHTFRSHIENVAAKVNKAIPILYSLINRRSRLSRDNKLLLYKVAIRPIMTYAAPVLHDVAKTHIRKLQIIQNKVLRMILNADYSTRISTLHESAGIDTIHQHIDKLTEKFLLTIPEEDIAP